MTFGMESQSIREKHRKMFDVMRVKYACSMFKVARLDKVRTEESNRRLGARQI